MPDFLQLVSQLREQMHATLSRSDILRPIAWLIGILTTTTVLLVVAQAPEWLLFLIAGLLVAMIALYGFAYLFCLVSDRDALRSENYSLQKMAIEHNLIGDSTTGLFEPRETDGLGGDSTKQIEHKS
jgi:hypothetical protein